MLSLRELTREHGVVLIFDEVITGFRWSRGGAQERFGITPDMCVLAKIVAGGLPGGAVAGRADIMDQLDAAAAKSARPREDRPPGHLQRQSAVRGSRRRHALHHRDARTCARRPSARPAEIRDGHAPHPGRKSRFPGVSTARPPSFLIFQNPNRLPIDPAKFDPRKLGFKGLKGRAQSRPRLSAAHRPARQRRRHHGRAGRPCVGDARPPRGRADARGFPHLRALAEG